MFRTIGLGVVVMFGTVATAFAGGDWYDHLHWWKAPEIDAGSAIAGLTMLAGALAIMRGRRTKQNQK
jgi:hypothetical protein